MHLSADMPSTTGITAFQNLASDVNAAISWTLLQRDYWATIGKRWGPVFALRGIAFATEHIRTLPAYLVSYKNLVVTTILENVYLVSESLISGIVHQIMLWRLTLS